MFNVEQAIEAIADKVHQGWMQEKLAQGFADHLFSPYASLPERCDHCVNKEDTIIRSLGTSEKYPRSMHHPDMIPYAELPEHIKEYDRKTARMVFQWLQENDWRIVHPALQDDLEAENEAQAEMIVEYGNTVAELRQRLAEVEKRKKAQNAHLEHVEIACHGAKEQLFHVKRKLASAQAQLGALGGEPVKYAPERFESGRRWQRLQKAKERIGELERQLAEAHEAVQVIALMRQHEKEATVVDRGYISERGWNELKDENKRLNERLAKLAAVLEQIQAGGWTGAGDRQGATYAEIRAMKMAKGALEK